MTSRQLLGVLALLSIVILAAFAIHYIDGMDSTYDWTVGSAFQGLANAVASMPPPQLTLSTSTPRSP